MCSIHINPEHDPPTPHPPHPPQTCNNGKKNLLKGSNPEQDQAQQEDQAPAGGQMGEGVGIRTGGTETSTTNANL